MADCDIRILRALRRTNGPQPFSELQKAAHCSSAEIARSLASLTEAGYDFSHHPHLGCCLEHTPDRLVADDLLARLDGIPLARRIHVYEETASTNDLAAQMARNGAPEGTVLFAEHQTAGRGRQGRTWDSPSHTGLWFSLILRPELPADRWTCFTTWAAVAIAEALQPKLSQPVQIRWPNDLLIDEAKVCGILLEAHDFLIVGIGLNVNQTIFPEGLRTPATSLRLATGQSLDRMQLAADILRALDSSYRTACHDFPSLIERAWSRSSLRDRPVQIVGGPEPLSGTVIGLDETGALLIRDDNGTLHTIRSGEILPVSPSPPLPVFPPTSAPAPRGTKPCAESYPRRASSL